MATAAAPRPISVGSATLGRELPFRAGPELERDALRFARDLALEAGSGVPVAAPGWAVAVTLMLLAHSDDDPDYRRLGRDCLNELAAG